MKFLSYGKRQRKTTCHFTHLLTYYSDLSHWTSLMLSWFLFADGDIPMKSIYFGLHWICLDNRNKVLVANICVTSLPSFFFSFMADTPNWLIHTKLAWKIRLQQVIAEPEFTVTWLINLGKLLWNPFFRTIKKNIIDNQRIWYNKYVIW